MSSQRLVILVRFGKLRLIYLRFFVSRYRLGRATRLKNIDAVIVHVLQKDLGQIRDRCLFALRCGDDFRRIAGGNTAQPLGKPAAIEDNGVHTSENLYIAAIFGLIPGADRAAGSCQNVQNQQYRVIFLRVEFLLQLV